LGAAVRGRRPGLQPHPRRAHRPARRQWLGVGDRARRHRLLRRRRGHRPDRHGTRRGARLGRGHERRRRLRRARRRRGPDRDGHPRLRRHVERGRVTADPLRWLWALTAVGLWLLLVAAVAWTRARARRAGAARAAALAPAEDANALLIAFASQTGQAEELAWMTADSLSGAGVPSRVVLLGGLEPEQLKAAGRALIIASTTGEGDSPDALSGFARRHMTTPADLSGLSYGLLALGDRSYADFCGFGRTLDTWLQRSGAAPLFDRIEVAVAHAD